MRVGFLAHDQSSCTKPKTFISKDDADLLVVEMVAEKISNKLIRAFPPDSPFRLLRSRSEMSDLPKISFGSGEISGTRYREPSDPAWQELHAMAARSLRTRSYMTLKSWKQQFVAPSPQQELQRASA
jgi:hypothetical protein